MYHVRLLANVCQERKKLPGNIRQRLKAIIDALADDPRPYNSIALQLDNNAERALRPVVLHRKTSGGASSA